MFSLRSKLVYLAVSLSIIYFTMTTVQVTANQACLKQLADSGKSAGVNTVRTKSYDWLYYPTFGPLPVLRDVMIKCLDQSYNTKVTCCTDNNEVWYTRRDGKYDYCMGNSPLIVPLGGENNPRRDWKLLVFICRSDRDTLPTDAEFEPGEFEQEEIE